MCPEIDYVFATLKTTTTTTPADCTCYYQLKPCYVNSSRKFTKISSSPTKTTSTTRTTTAASLGFSINFRPNFCHIFLLYTTLLLLLFQHCLLGIYAAPQSCILCDINDLKANEKSSHSSSYEEFLFEHQVTRQDAIMALRLLNDSFYDGMC